MSGSRARRFLLAAVFGVLALAVVYRLSRSQRVRRWVQAASSSAAAADEGPSIAGPGTRAKQTFQIAEPIFSGGLKPGWQDYGWAKREAAGPGPAKLDLSNNSGWILAKPGFAGGRFGAVVFRMRAPKEYGEFLEVMLMSESDDAYTPVVARAAHRVDLEDGWSEVLIPMRTLNPRGVAFDRLRLKAIRSVGSAWVMIDGLAFTAAGAEAEVPVTFPARDVAMKVECKLPGDRISPYIYGVASAEAPAEMNASAYRWGGNRASRYNWELGTATNAGSDWFFQNVLTESATTFIETAAKRGAVAGITVPMTGWVARDTTSFSFPISVFGPQKQADYTRTDSGNGERANGTKIPPGPQSRTSVPSTEESIRRWVEANRQADVRRGRRTVREYMLDNEPMLWNSTHRDVHPDPVGYDELLERTIRYGTAVRSADPEAVISGPAEWGWDGYWWSAKDAVAGLKSKPDRLAHGDMPLLGWYLMQLREHEKRTGTRLLDVLDVHFYPEGQEVKPPGGTEPSTNALRIRQTRGLWDPSYVDESWIKDTIRLIPRLKELVALHYPGRGISIGEWNFGAEKHMSGALAVAEAFGRFAQGGLTSAYYWDAPKKGMPAYWAFRAYRNFDGANGRFQDTWIPTVAGPETSLFASKDDSGKHLVLVAINFDHDKSAQVKLDLSACGSVATRKTFTYWGQTDGLVPVAPHGADGSAIEETLQPYSITVFDVRLAP